MKNKMIITSIIYAIMSCTHIVLAMDKPRQSSQSNDNSFIPLDNIPNSMEIAPQPEYVFQGYIKNKENDTFEIYHTSTETAKPTSYITVSQKDIQTIEHQLEKNEDIYTSSLSNDNIFLKLNKESLTPLESVCTQRFAQITVQTEDTFRQQYQQETSCHLEEQQARKKKKLNEQLSRSSSSDDVQPIKSNRISHNLRLPNSTADEVITTPESIRSRSANNSRSQSPVQSSSGTSNSLGHNSNDSTSNSGDSSPIYQLQQHPTSLASSSANLPKKGFSTQAITIALDALSSSNDSIIDDNKDLLASESQKDKKAHMPTAEQTPFITLEQQLEKSLNENEKSIEQTLTPVVGSIAACALVEGSEITLDIVADLLATDSLTGRPLEEMIDDFRTLPCYDIIATTNNEDNTLSITFTDHKDMTKTISVTLLLSKKPIIATHIIVENKEGNPDYLLKYVEDLNPVEPQINPQKDQLKIPYYKQYPGRIFAGSMSILAAFIMVAYHYNHLPESIMSMLDQLKDLLSKTMPFTQSR